MGFRRRQCLYHHKVGTDFSVLTHCCLGLYFNSASENTNDSDVYVYYCDTQHLYYKTAKGWVGPFQHLRIQSEFVL